MQFFKLYIFVYNFLIMFICLRYEDIFKSEYVLFLILASSLVKNNSIYNIYFMLFWFNIDYKKDNFNNISFIIKKFLNTFG